MLSENFGTFQIPYRQNMSQLQNHIRYPLVKGRKLNVHKRTFNLRLYPWAIENELVCAYELLTKH